MSAYTWLQAEADHVTKGVPYPTIATKMGVERRTVERHASKHSWGEKRREFVGKVSGAVAAELAGPAVVRAVAQAVDYTTQHLDDWQTLRNALMEVIEHEKDPIERVKAAVAGFKLIEAAQKGQRLSLGLDKPTPEKPDEQGAKAILLVPADSDDWQEMARANDDSRGNGQNPLAT